VGGWWLQKRSLLQTFCHVVPFHNCSKHRRSGFSQPLFTSMLVRWNNQLNEKKQILTVTSFAKPNFKTRFFRFIFPGHWLGAFEPRNFETSVGFFLPGEEPISSCSPVFSRIGRAMLLFRKGGPCAAFFRNFFCSFHLSFSKGGAGKNI